MIPRSYLFFPHVTSRTSSIPLPVLHVLRDTSKKKLCSRDQRSDVFLCFLPSGPFCLNIFRSLAFVVQVDLQRAQSSRKTLKDLTGFYSSGEWRSRVSSRVLQRVRKDGRKEGILNGGIHRLSPDVLMDVNGFQPHAMWRSRITRGNLHQMVSIELCQF